MWRKRLYCPACGTIACEYEFQLEGEISEPDPSQQLSCDCGWRGALRDLAQEPLQHAPAELDFQI